MFDYCQSSPFNIKIAIENFLSHEWNWEDENGDLVTFPIKNEEELIDCQKEWKLIQSYFSFGKLMFDQ